MPWDEMTGTERVRDCSQCRRQVFNISEMTNEEAEAFLVENGDSQCLTYYRRKDGTIMTDDCPVALRKLRNQLRGLRRAAGLLVTTILSVGTAFAQKAETPVKPLNDNGEHQGLSRTMGRVQFVDTFKYTLPPIAELKSGKHALGEELSQRGDDLFLKISEKPSESATFKYNHSMFQEQKLSCDLSPRVAYSQGNLYENANMPKAAEDYYKLALKLFQANENKIPALQTSIAASYRNLLLKEKRPEEARNLEKEFNLPKQ